MLQAMGNYTVHPYDNTTLTSCGSGFTMLRHIREVLALVVRCALVRES